VSCDPPDMRGTEADLPELSLVVYSDAEQRGGAEVTLTHLLTGLPEQVGVRVVGVDDDVVAWLADQRGSDGVVLEPIRSRRDLGAMRQHARTFRQLGADLVQFNLSMSSSCQWAAFMANLTRQRTVLVENSSMGAWSATSRRLKRFNSARATAHVAVGERTARLIEADAGLRPGTVGTLYHGVPDVARHPHRDGRGTRLVNVARHDPVKGLDVLLEAMALLDDDVTLTQIGGGPDHDRLVEHRDGLGLRDRVEFAQLPWEVRAGDEIGRHDIFVLSSRVEGLPVTIMEAMLAGVAIVATDVGSVREELDDGRTGRIVAAEDPAGLAAVVGELVADGAQRLRLGDAARTDALERFTVDATVARYASVYRSALRGRP